MEKEIQKLQEEIEVIKQEIDRPPEYDETLTSNGSSIQAGLGPPGPIGEVIAELKAHNNAKAVKKKEGITQELNVILVYLDAYNPKSYQLLPTITDFHQPSQTITNYNKL